MSRLWEIKVPPRVTDSIKFTNDEVNNLLKEVINFYKELRKIEVNANRFNLE